MRLLAKFNLVLLVVFGAGMGVAAFLSYRFLRDDARDQVVQQARLLMETMRSARDYTTKQIKPLLQNQQEHLRAFFAANRSRLCGDRKLSLRAGKVSAVRI